MEFQSWKPGLFILILSYADVPCAVAQLLAEWEWGRHASPASLTFQEGGSCPSSPSPCFLLVLQEGRQVKKVDEVGQKEGSL